ncbi:MAG TPA: acyltransferase [Methylibium sp.]|uniref:acyltransferase family protein n=1 Tax=Methylibium sp. TaxID=2067992 RepID=UPI002DBDACF9|nr:acyltransferase [Methylibium sp.]HEU4458574.1 acyltransferase [Methylibium sp.]
MQNSRYTQLDGWRGISILLVLAAHLLPLGPKALRANEAAGMAGMAIFFTLSGFLITTFLLKRPAVLDFLARRFFRIVPLVWLVAAIALAVFDGTAEQLLAHLFFYANLPPFQLIDATAPLWSVCVEVQFYVGIALLYAAFGVRGLWLVPVLALFFTLLRFDAGLVDNIVTWARVDEILAGCCVALALHRWPKLHDDEGLRRKAVLARWLLLPLFVASCHPSMPFGFSLLRPYATAALVATTLLAPVGLLESRRLAYVAAISFALYVIHPLLVHSPLGSGDTLERYAKRPLLIAVLWALAHLSTFHFERHWIRLGHWLGRRFGSGRQPALEARRT